ncbi:MAG: hypothetical protein ACR2P4_00210, partial [Gammaproteobacteria bacterium]
MSGVMAAADSLIPPPPFPSDKPDAYRRLDGEPPFDAARHLALEKPAAVLSLADMGYDEAVVSRAPSPLGVSTAFRIFSDEGLAVVGALAAKMKDNRNEASGTGKDRLGSYVRGAGYRSRFVRDFCRCPELAAFLSELTGAPVASHSVPAVACGINYAPEDISRAVDTWHVDSVSFDMVILLTDPAAFRGGEFQYFRGTKTEGERLLGGGGESGTQNDLPPERVDTMRFPAAGYGFLQQGNMVFHRARRLLARAERTTMIPSFVVLGGGDGTNVAAMSKWNDPCLPAELARHEAWLAENRLRQLIESLPLSSSPLRIADALD